MDDDVFNVTAVSDATKYGYALGKHRWLISGDDPKCHRGKPRTPYTTFLKLTGCLLIYDSTCSNTSSGPVGQIPGWWGQRGGPAGTIWQVINKKLISYEKQHYQRLGDEGFLLAPYSPLLRLAKKHSKTVKLKGGFVPKRFTFIFSGKISWLKSKS